MKKNRFFGPSTLIAAAFIGPGTVTVCMLTGQNTGYSLLWALLLALLITGFFQEMSGRLGLVSGAGLGEAVRTYIQPIWWRKILVAACLLAIVLGNAAYEGGNITGASLGLQALFGEWSYISNDFQVQVWSLVAGILAFVILYFGKNRYLEFMLIALVLIMSLVFLLTMVLLKPDLQSIFKGLMIPSFAYGQILSIMALIGTTVVPYNLFLHAAIVKNKWKSGDELPLLRMETIVAVALGGIISMSIIIVAAAGLPASEDGIRNALDMSRALEPVLGSKSPILLGLGLFSAGISSAMTAPLAAGYTLQGLLNWQQPKKIKAVVLGMVVLGTAFASLGIQPIRLISMAQVTNAFVLPFIVLALLIVVNHEPLMKNFKNRRWQNILGIIFLVICLFSAFRLL